MSLKTSSALAAEVVVPGSVANLGGGFDTLGVAVRLYLRARIVDVRDDGSLYRRHQSTGDGRYYVAPDVAMLPVDALGFRAAPER